MRYRQRHEHPASVIAGEAAIVTQDDSRLHVLNPVGTVIWELCDDPEGRSLDQLVTALLERYDVDDATARAETLAFIERAVTAGVLEAVEGDR